MAFSSTITPAVSSAASTSLCHLQQSCSVLVPSLKLHPLLFSYSPPPSSFKYRTRPKHHRFFHVRASSSNAILDSANGAVAAASEDQDSYGRQFFPLAAVVGQVYNLKLKLITHCLYLCLWMGKWVLSFSFFLFLTSFLDYRSPVLLLYLFANDWGVVAFS